MISSLHNGILRVGESESFSSGPLKEFIKQCDDQEDIDPYFTQIKRCQEIMNQDFVVRILGPQLFL
jgi:hypothetical protein